MSKLISTVSIILLFAFFSQIMTPAIVFADNNDTETQKLVTPLRKNEKAPYTGVLVSKFLAAEIITRCNPVIIQSQCKILTDEAVSLANSACKTKNDFLQAKLDAENLACKKIISAKDVEIDVLRKQISSPPLLEWYEKPAFYFVGGVIVGAAVIFGSTYAVSQLK